MRVIRRASGVRRSNSSKVSTSVSPSASRSMTRMRHQIAALIDLEQVAHHG